MDCVYTVPLSQEHFRALSMSRIVLSAQTTFHTSHEAPSGGRRPRLTEASAWPVYYSFHGN